MSLASTLWPLNNPNRRFELWALGENTNGQCGVGTTTDLATWTRVGTSTDWISIACGRNHTLALKDDGTLWAWGDNSLYQLGNGTTVDSTTPIQIGTDTDWYMIGCTENGSFATKTNGALYRWGKPFNFISTTYTTPSLWVSTLGTGSDQGIIQKFDCGLSHIVALTDNSRVWTVGENGSGQLGNNSTVDRTSFVMIANPKAGDIRSDWCQDISAGFEVTAFYHYNDGFYVTGNGSYNGVPGTSNVLVPTKIAPSRPASPQLGSDGNISIIGGNTTLSNFIAFGAISNGAIIEDGTGGEAYPAFNYTTHSLYYPAGQGIFRRNKTTGTVSEANFTVSDFTIWSDLPTTVNNLAYLTGYRYQALEGTERRLFAFRYITPTAAMSVTKLNDSTVEITNTSTGAQPYTPTGLTADNRAYVINWGDGTSTIVPNNTSAGAPGQPKLTHTYTNTKDTRFTITLTAYNTIESSNSQDSETVDIFVPQNPIITPTGLNLNVPTVTFVNTTADSLGSASIFGAGNKWRWDFDGTVVDVAAGSGLAGDRNVNINHTFTFATNAVGRIAQNKTITLTAYNSHSSSPFTSSITLGLYPEPILDFTLAAVGDQLSITNTSLNADSYVVHINDGTNTVTYPVASNSAPGGSGAAPLLIPAVTKDTSYSVYISTTLEGVPSPFTSATKTQKVYAVITPVIALATSSTLSSLQAFGFSNITAIDSLGATAQYTNNKWRWEWGDGTYTDVVVGTGLAGDYDTVINKTYTLTLEQINAGLPIQFTVTLKAYNGHPSSPFTGNSITVTVLPNNPTFPNRVNTTLDDANIPDIVEVRTTKRWGVAGGGWEI